MKGKCKYKTHTLWFGVLFKLQKSGSNFRKLFKREENQDDLTFSNNLTRKQEVTEGNLELISTVHVSTRRTCPREREQTRGWRQATEHEKTGRE